MRFRNSKSIIINFKIFYLSGEHMSRDTRVNIMGSILSKFDIKRSKLRMKKLVTDVIEFLWPLLPTSSWVSAVSGDSKRAICLFFVLPFESHNIYARADQASARLVAVEVRTGHNPVLLHICSSLHS